VGIYEHGRFWWMLLEGHNRRRENTGIRCDATSPQVRKANKLTAEAIYHAKMTQLARRRADLPTDTGETFQSFSEWFEEHHVTKHRGADRERVILRRLRQHFGQMLLTDIRPARWTEYETIRLEDGVSLNTVGRELSLMKSVLVAAVGEHLDVSPLAHVKRKSTQLPAKYTLTAADERRLLKEIDDDEIRDLYLVGVGTLLRQMNLITLQRRHHYGTRLVVQTKTGPHQIALTGPTILQTRAAMVLKRRLPKTADGYFFPTWHARFAANRDSGNAWFLKHVRRACKRAGLRWGLAKHGVVWHTMTRASGATRMLRQFGIDVRTVQLIGNWRSLDQMASYLGVDPHIAVSSQTRKRA
jgi:hypothetical protein